MEATYEKIINSISKDYKDQTEKLSADSFIRLEKSFEEKLTNLKEYKKKCDAEKPQKSNIKNMTKICNDNFHERDMKAMSGHHNENFIRMLKLHEEVQEMNKHYKNETDSMKVQYDENIRQNGQKSLETISDLENQHTCELKEMANIHKNTLVKFKAAHEEEKNELSQKLIKDLQDVENFHRGKFEELAEQLEKHTDEVKRKYEKDFKALQEEHSKKLETMKKQFDEFRDVKEKFQKKMENCQLPFKDLQVRKGESHDCVPETKSKG
jgi:hypothetical protein